MVPGVWKWSQMTPKLQKYKKNILTVVSEGGARWCEPQCEQTLTTTCAHPYISKLTKYGSMGLEMVPDDPGFAKI